MGSWQINMRLLFRSEEQCEAGINKPCSFLIYFHQWRILNKMNTRVFRSEFGVHCLFLNYEILRTTSCFYSKNPELGCNRIRKAGTNHGVFCPLCLKQTLRCFPRERVTGVLHLAPCTPGLFRSGIRE